MWCLFLSSIGHIIGPISVYTLVYWCRMRSAFNIGSLCMTLSSSYANMPFLLSRMVSGVCIGIKYFLEYTIVAHSEEEHVERNFIILQLASSTVLLAQHLYLQNISGHNTLSASTLQRLFSFLLLVLFYAVS